METLSTTTRLPNDGIMASQYHLASDEGYTAFAMLRDGKEVLDLSCYRIIARFPNAQAMEEFCKTCHYRWWMVCKGTWISSLWTPPQTIFAGDENDLG